MATWQEKVSKLKQGGLSDGASARIQALKASSVGRVPADPDSVIEVPKTEPDEADRAVATRDTMIAEGHPPAAVRRTVFAQSSRNMMSIPAGHAPMDSSQIANEETVQKLETDLGYLFGTERPGMLGMFQRWGSDKVDDLAESRKWWNRQKRAVSQKAGTLLDEGATNFQFGLALLDWAQWANKKMKLAAVPGIHRAEVEQRVLPRLKLGEKEYSTGTSAAINLMTQKTRGYGEIGMGATIYTLGDMLQAPIKAGIKLSGRTTQVPENMLQQFGQFMEQAGTDRVHNATEQVPALIAAKGDQLSWTEVVQRQNYTPEEMENGLFYSDINDLGKYRDMALVTQAVGDAFAEIELDPFLLFSRIPVKGVEALRALHTRFDPESAMRIKGAIARSTYKMEDAVTSYKAAKEQFETLDASIKAKSAMVKDVTGTGKVDVEDYRSLVKAREAMLREEQHLHNFKDAGANEIIMHGAAKRHPDEIPDMKATEVYFAPIGIKEETISTRMDQATTPIPHKPVLNESEMKQVKKLAADELLAPPAKKGFSVVEEAKSGGEVIHPGGYEGDTRDFIPQKGVIFITLSDDVENTLLRDGQLDIEHKGTIYTLQPHLRYEADHLTESPDSKWKEGMGDLYIAKPKVNSDKVANKQIMVAKIKGKLQEWDKYITGDDAANNTLANKVYDQVFGELPRGRYLGGKRTKISMLEGLRSEEVNKPLNQVQSELYEIRKRELQNNSSAPIEWNNVDELPLFEKRALMGPDDAETAGDGLSHMLKTGGTGVDDVTVYPLSPEYGGLPSSKLGLINWRAADRANAGSTAAKEFEQVKQYDLFTSTERMLAQQEDVIKRNLGYARATGDKGAIKVYNKHLNAVKKARRFDVSRNWKPEDFDESWLPPEAKNVMDTPESYNNWLLTARDRVMASIYPGGMAYSIHNVAVKSPALQGLSMLRPNPFKFFDFYAPGSGERFRGQMLRYDQEHRTWSEMVTASAEKAGLLKARGKFNPKRHWNRYTIDQTKNELAFDILNMVPNDPEYEQLLASAPKELQDFTKMIRSHLDHQADLQAVPERGRAGRITGYIHHVFDRRAFAGGARPLEFVGIPKNAEVFAAHLLPRTGEPGYPRDALLALDIYGRAAARKRIIEPMYDDIIQTGAEIAAKHKFPGGQSFANDFISELQGKPTFLGAKLDDALGPMIKKTGGKWMPSAIDRSLSGMTTLFWSGIIAGNRRYPVMQMANAVATTSGRYGIMRTARGLLEMATPEGQALAKQIGTYHSFESIYESDAFRKLSSVLTEHGYTIGPLGIQSTGSIEEAVRGMTGLAAVDMHLNHMGFATFDEAVEAGYGGRVAFEALRSAEEVNHMFGAMGRSPWVARFFPKWVNTAATQFLGFVPKQIEELSYQAGRNPGKIMEFMMISGWLSRLAAEEMGTDITDYVGLGFVPKAPDDMTSPATDTFMKILGLMSAASNRDPEETAKKAEEVTNSLTMMIPLMGSVESSMRDFERMKNGASYTATEDRQRSLVPPMKGTESSFKSLGGDVIPLLSGQQPIRDSLFRLGQSAMRVERKNKFYARKTALTGLVNSFDDGKYDETVKYAENLAALGMPINGDMAAQVRKARELSWVFRTLENDQSMIPYYMDIIDNFGIDMEP